MAAVLTPLALALGPATALGAAPTCNNMNVSVPHNAATPIFIDCTGGTGSRVAGRADRRPVRQRAR